MNFHQITSAIPIFFLLAVIGLFTGIEEIDNEHSTEYQFFAKQAPSFQIVFKNPVACGECDVRPLELLSGANKVEFADYCRFRFGLHDSRLCYAIFAEEQKAADQRRLGSEAPIPSHPDN